MDTIIIPKKITKGEELMVIPRKRYEELLQRSKHIEGGGVSVENVLRWSQEAKELKKKGKLPLLRSLKEFR